MPRYVVVAAVFGFWLPMTLCLLGIAAWITHVVVCIKAASWLLLIAGAIVFPVAIIHGWMVWFGFA